MHIPHLLTFHKTGVSAIAALTLLFCSPSTVRAEAAGSVEPVNIGSRLELFVDDFLVDTLTGDARRVMHRPEPREIIMEFGDYGPTWESDRGGAFPALVQDGDRIRIYYSAAPRRPASRRQRACVIESEDGIHFHRPDVGLHEVHGSTENNVVWPGDLAGHHFTPFLDTRTGVADDERFKAFARGPGGMRFYASPDGYDWRLMDIEPKLTPGPSDTQNVVFWDSVRERYVAYLRAFRSRSGLRPPDVDFYGRDADGNRGSGMHRCIRRAVSTNLIDWTETEFIEYDDDRVEQLYTNGIRPYDRAPHLYIGLPNRFVTGRQKVAAHPHRGINDALLMSSRDGIRFQRWAEAFIRPGPDPEVWTERNNYPVLGMVRTSPTELSIYWNEHNRYPTQRLRRGTLRVDGFASLHAGSEVGEMLTRPLIFDGNRLVVNYRTSAEGDMRFELTDVAGEPIPGFSMGDSEALFGNAIKHLVSWSGGTDLSELAGRPVRLRVRLRDADLYAIRFEPADDILGRLAEQADQARALLADPLPAFAERCLEALRGSLEFFDHRLARDRELGHQATLEGGFLIRRALHRYRGCQRLERQARRALDQAGGVSGKAAGFGALYRDSTILLREGLQAALSDATGSADAVRLCVTRIEGVLADMDRVVEAADRANDLLADAAEALVTGENGFGALYRARIAELKPQLRGHLGDSRASLAMVERAIGDLGEALARYQTVEDFAPLRPREITELPVSLTLGGRTEWERGQRVNLVADGDALVLPFAPEMVFPVETDAAVQMPAPEALQSPVVTVEAWVRLANTLGFLVPVFRLGGSSEATDIYRSAWFLCAHIGGFLFALGSEKGEALVSTRTGQAVSSDRWHHVAAVFDGQEVRMYFDGELSGSSEFEGSIDPTHTEALWLGGNPARRSADRFEGSIRDVRIWNKVRSEAEIRGHMHRELTGREEGLAGYWLAGSHAGAADTVYDQTGNDNHGRVSGAVWRENRGYRIADPLVFTDIAVPAEGRIDWRAETAGNADASQLTILAGWSAGADELPQKWDTVASGRPLPMPEAEIATSERGPCLWLKQVITSKEPDAVIRLKAISLELRF